MKLLGILCKCEDFYELCKHNYNPKKHKQIFILNNTITIVQYCSQEREHN